MFHKMKRMQVRLSWKLSIFPSQSKASDELDDVWKVNVANNLFLFLDSERMMFSPMLKKFFSPLSTDTTSVQIQFSFEK